jgi:hypothetical protein
MSRKLGKGMRTLLEALPEHEGCLYPGATMGELKASGATPYLLRKARELGWANMEAAHALGNLAGQRLRRTRSYLNRKAGVDRSRKSPPPNTK